MELSASDLDGIVRKFAEVPGLVGTEGEKKRMKLCLDLFSDLGLEPKIEEFICVRGWVGSILQIIFLFLSMLTAVSVYFIFTDPIFCLPIIIFLIGLILIMLPRLNGNSTLPLIGKKYRSYNIYAELPHTGSSCGEGAPEYVIISGHYDTKSQLLSSKMRILAAIMAFFGGLGAIVTELIYIFITTVLSAGSDNIKIIILIFAVVGITGMVMLSLNFLGNASPGALDNASSAAVIYGIARLILKNNTKKFPKVILLMTGAEELGMWGARAFVRKHLAEFPPDRTVNINIDMVGMKGHEIEFMESFGPGKKQVSEYFSGLINETARRSGIKVKGFWLPIGAGTDGFVFRNYGYEGCDFNVPAAASFAHTDKDNFDKWDGEVGLKYVRFIMALIEDLCKGGKK